MEVIYRACDGREFTSQEACLEYEKKNTTFRMYDRYGEPTDFVDKALLLNLCHPNSITDFLQRCEKEYSTSGGIYKDSEPGWYWWHEDGYILIDNKMVTALYLAGYFWQ